MNSVKFYVICETELDRRFATEQIQYIQNGNDEREGKNLNVKYLLSSYNDGFHAALKMIESNVLFEFGVILLGNDHFYRRLYTAIDMISQRFTGRSIFLYVSNGHDFSASSAPAHDFIIQELVPKLFTVYVAPLEGSNYTHGPTNTNTNTNAQPCFVSKSFLKLKHDKKGEIGFVKPPLSVTSKIYNESSFVYYDPVKIEYVQSLSMVHYIRKRNESLFNTLFDGVYCINLESRPDRLQKFQQKMKLHNIKFEKYNAVSKLLLDPIAKVVMPDDPLLEGSKNKSGLLGCLLSHMGVMKVALSRRQKQILIFEDDVAIHKDAELHLESFLTSLVKNSIEIKNLDVIHFGYVPVVEKGDFNTRDVWSYRFLNHINGSGTLLKSKHFIGCHAYAVSEKFMKAYINFYASLEAVPNENTSEWPTNDWAIRNFFLENKDFLCVAPCPQIFSVSPSVSDNSGLLEDDKVEQRVTNANFTYCDDYD